LSVMPRDPLQPNLVQIGVHMGVEECERGGEGCLRTYLLEGFQKP